MQFYNRLEEAGGEITEEFLWYRLAPLLGYLDLAEKQQVRLWSKRYLGSRVSIHCFSVKVQN